MAQEIHASEAQTGTTLVEVKGLKVHFPIKGGLLNRAVAHVKAVDGVDLFIKRGETLGLVGESGCGKSTTGRAILQLIKPTAGSVKLDGVELTRLDANEIRLKRAEMQMIFQDPFGSLNPRFTIGQTVAEPLENFNRGNKKEIQEQVASMLEVVGLNPFFMNRFAHEFSGGQRQRIGIARALALRPSFIVADEPVSALDVSIQAQVINLLEELQQNFGLTYQLYENALHPYTQALLSAIPVPDPEMELKRKRIILEGDVPSPVNPPPGCNFNPRCWKAQDICREIMPPLEEKSPNHFAACHFPG